MSIPMRVTQSGADLSMIQTLDAGLARLSQLQQQVATGRAINQPSDNPGGTATALQLSAQIGRFQQYGANASNGQGWLNAADSALSSVNTALQNVQTYVLEGANATGSDQATRNTLAQQVNTIKQTLLTTASTQYLDQPIFSGTWNTQPYANAATGDYTYTGSPQAPTRNVGPNQTMQVGVTAAQAFGSGTTSVFAVLDQISADLTSGNSTALSGNDLTALKSAMTTASTAQGQIGSWSANLAQISTSAGNTVQALKTSMAGIVDVDEASATANLQLQEVAYQAALATTAKVIQPSLVNYLA